MNRKLLAVVMIAALAVAGVWLYRTRRQAPANYLRISGNFELTEVSIAFKTSGKLLERAVNEGDRVAKGMILARLDRDQLLRQKDREEAALAAVQAQLAEAETALRWQRETLAADLSQRRAEVRSNEAKLAELKNGSRPQEIRQVLASVEAAQSEYDRASKDWERAQTLYKDDDISTSQFDQYRMRFETAAAMLREVKEREALVQAGPRVEVVDAAAAQTERARASLKVGEANGIETERREQEVTARRAEIARARAQIALLNSQLEDTVVASPIDGVVLVKSADVGEVLAPGTTVMTVGDLEHPWLRGYIGERDLGKVKLGSPARLTTDSFPGKVYNGHVSFISSEAEFTPKQIQTQEERVKLVYRIKIEVENPNQELKLNMPADAEIELRN